MATDRPGVSSAQPQNPAPAQQANFQYTGPGSCAASACHGAVPARTDLRIPQNEYSVWITQDRHSRAFEVLRNPVSQRMARLLGIERADAAPKCLACHALAPPAAQRARTFSAEEGVSCESCHGPASQWLGPHTRADWAHEKSLQLGMNDTKDLIRRTEVCLSCHLGNAEKFVDHEMIAAGHPDLIFELDSFSAAMPRHWKEPVERDPWTGARAWSTGMAVQLREHLERVSRRARGGPWPEYAELDCFACHHDLARAEDSWRQDRGYPGRRAGVPPWNVARYTVFRQVAGLVGADAGQRLDAEMTRLSGLMNQLAPNREEVAVAAARTSSLAGEMARRMAQHNYDPETALRLMRAISSDAERISGEGVRSAEQAVMALDSLFIATSRNTRLSNQAELRAALNALYPHLENPARYQPGRFAADLRRVNSLLR